MLSPRNTIVAALAFVVVWMAVSIGEAVFAPVRGEKAADSFGTRWAGQRALFELFERVGQSPRRHMAPYPPPTPDGSPLLLLAPDDILVLANNDFFENTVTWVRDGGSLLLSAGMADDSFGLPGGLFDDATSAAVMLGLSSLRFSQTDFRPGSGPTRLVTPRRIVEPEKATPAVEPEERRAVLATVRGSGALAPLAAGLASVALPRNGLRLLDAGTTDSLLGVLSIDRPEFEGRALAALFRVGRGRVLVVPDPRLFANGMMQYEGGAPLAVALVSILGENPHFDEFYHGRSVRGNAFWLVTDHRFAALGACLLLALVLWAWRGMVRLAPPAPPGPAPRPDITLHLDMMASLLDRPHFRLDTLRTLRDGVVRTVAVELGGQGARRSEESVLRQLHARRDPRAGRLEDALRTLRALEQRGGRIRGDESAKLGMELAKCLSKN